MLVRLLRSFLRPYVKVLAAVAVLQLLQTLATLLLPSLNADIIDNGVATGDTAYIWRVGLLMLAVTVVQIAFAVGAVYYGSRASMGFGRDVRAGLFHRVTGFSARGRSTQFGAPSLITRITNDVQQVQMLALHDLHAPHRRAGHGDRWRHPGRPRGRRVVARCCSVSIPVLLIAIGLVISRMVPQFRLMQVRIDRVNQVLREQITGMRVVRAFVREPEESARFGAANGELTDDLAGRGPAAWR